MKILTIIPAYNEENTIGEVVHQVKYNFPSADILVINDGSRDNTSIRAKDAGAIVVDLPFNLGIGGAMQTGFLFAKRKAMI
jgi:glycosyltransferase involved in cell wall biosynthesis